MLSWIMFTVRSIEVSRKSPCKPYPALFSKMSIATDLASRLLFRRLAAPGEARSIASTNTSTPYLRRRSEASFSIGSCRRAANTRLTFRAASRSANSRPRPLDAPVIRAHFPANLFIVSTVAPGALVKAGPFFLETIDHAVAPRRDRGRPRPAEDGCHRVACFSSFLKHDHLAHWGFARFILSNVVLLLRRTWANAEPNGVKRRQEHQGQH